tara:strand:+ start:7310 stop:7588 length:279 start_codon:yes stop_codon:yes gene_type:complete
MLDLKLIKEDIADINPDALLADGLDEAIIGVGNQFTNTPVVVYDYDKCIEIFMRDNDWDYEDAMDWMQFNVIGAYMGEGTPIFMTVFSQEEE